MKPYSIEFRQKIIEVHEKESLSRRKLAQRFCVSTNFVQKLLKQYRDTGNIYPQPQGGSPEPKLNQEQLIDLIEIIETHNDATLEELCERLAEKLQIRVSRATMGRLTQKLNYSVKKKLSTPQKKKVRKFSQSELSFGQKFEISA